MQFPFGIAKADFPWYHSACCKTAASLHRHAVTVSPVTWSIRPHLLTFLSSKGSSGVMSQKRLSPVSHHTTVLCNQVSSLDASPSMLYLFKVLYMFYTHMQKNARCYFKHIFSFIFCFFMQYAFLGQFFHHLTNRTGRLPLLLFP